MSGPPLGERPIGLILSGGAALASWQAGVLCALVKSHGLSFHSVLGTSAGSVNGAAYLQGEMEMIEELWRNVPRRRILRFSPRLYPPSLLSMDTVRRTLAGIISEDLCRERRRCWFYAVSVDIRSGGMVQAEYSPEPGGPWDGPLLDHVLGSVAVPFVFPPVPVESGGRSRLLVDGHVDCFALLKPLLERGVKDFLFVNVAGGGGERRATIGPRRFVSALIGEMMRAQVRNSLVALGEGGPEGDIRAYEFCPTEPLHMSVFGFKPKECRWAFDLGTRDAAAHMRDQESFRLL